MLELMKRLNQKGFHLLYIVLIVIVIAGLGFAGWYVWDKNQNQTAEEQTSSTPTPMPIGVDYVVEYPSTWIISSHSSSDTQLFVNKENANSSDYEMQIYKGKLSEMASFTDGDTGITYTPATSFEEFVTKYYINFGNGMAGGATVTSAETIITHSGNAYFMTYTDNWMGSRVTVYRSYMKINDNEYLEFIFKNDASPDLVSSYKQIIASLRLN